MRQRGLRFVAYWVAKKHTWSLLDHFRCVVDVPGDLPGVHDHGDAAASEHADRYDG
jgi:hypothetical protein